MFRQFHLSSVHILCRPQNTGWFIEIPHSWIAIIPTILLSIIHELIINLPTHTHSSCTRAPRATMMHARCPIGQPSIWWIMWIRWMTLIGCNSAQILETVDPFDMGEVNLSTSDNNDRTGTIKREVKMPLARRTLVSPRLVKWIQWRNSPTNPHVSVIPCIISTYTPIFDP